jgi:glycosyltransferase involved in cell wall biosynthesis
VRRTLDKVRVLTILSDLEHSKTFELIARHLDRDRFDVRALFLNPPREGAAPLEQYFSSIGIPTETWRFEGRRDYAGTLLRLRRHLKDGKYHAVHAHLMWADYLGMPAAWMAGVPNRLMTRWHATVHHREHPSGLKYDRIANRLATRIITPSRVTYRILTEWEHVPERKVTLLSPPLDVDAFSAPDPADVARLRERYNPEDRHPVIGVISRWVEWKGVQYIIPAVERLLERHPDLLLLLFNATGEYGGTLRALLSRMPERNYRVVPFEPRVEALYQIFDVFVHAPIDEFVETFGLVYGEAMAAGVPSVFTRSGGISGAVEHMRHSYLVPYRNADAIYEGLRTLLDDPELARGIARQARAALTDQLRPEAHVAALQELYAAGLEQAAHHPAA